MEHATMHAILHYLYDFLSFWTDKRELKLHLLARIERSGNHILGVNTSSAACSTASWLLIFRRIPLPADISQVA
jgi:hypothetical protein